MEIAILSMSSINPDEITTMRNEQHGLKMLLESTKQHGYTHEMLYVKTVFGGQMPVVVDWCKRNKDKYTHILYTDAFDTIALAGLDELISKIPKGIKFFGSAEKACYPHPELAPRYPKTTHDWKYVNAGQWFAEIDFFLRYMVEGFSPENINDQVWLSERYLDCFEKNMPVNLDFDCEIFQSIAFESMNDFATTAEGRIKNLKTNTMPVFIHDNGNKHDPLIWVYEMLRKPVDMNRSEIGWENENMRKNHPASETMKKILKQTKRSQ